MNTDHISPLPCLMSDHLIEAALREDLGRGGDLTSEATIPAATTATAVVLNREPGRSAGIQLCARTFSLLDPDLEVEILVEDGEDLAAGTQLLRVNGAARTILIAERTAINFLGRLCGVATLTRAFVEAVKASGARIADTRKTTPGLRALEKYAVRCGGGANHRFGLDDAVLIKDNHIAVAGGVTAAVRAARRHVGHTVLVELEVDTLEQLEEGLAAGIDAVLLDNMDTATLRRAVEIVNGRVVTEASGGITLETAAAVAATGVDLLSVGALTHSAPALDVSLDIVI
jgi:nicotinate-nucleotide pyrophosphorylase (carboxylating)